MKKKIPLSILANIDLLAKQNRELIEVVDDARWNLYFKDSDLKSDFYFRVMDTRDDRKYLTQVKPGKFDTVQEKSINIQDDVEIIREFKDWLAILKSYADTETVFDDPITEYYEKTFYKRVFETDEEGDKLPFEIPQQLFLEQHVLEIKSFVDENRDQLKDDFLAGNLQNACDEIIDELPKAPRNSIKRKIVKVWAMIAKNGLVKKFLSTVGSEFTKKLVQSSMDKGGEFLAKHMPDINAAVETFNDIIQ